jgi:hypothetical protein
VDVSGGVAGDPVDHVNLLKVFFSSEIASATCALSAAPTGGPGLFSLVGPVVFVRFWMRLRVPIVGLYGQIGYLMQT